MDQQFIIAEPCTDPPDLPRLKRLARWRINVDSDGDRPTPLKMVIWFDDTLEVLETNTPLVFDFVASNYTALIAAKSPGARIYTSAWSDLLGSFREAAGFGGGCAGELSFLESGESCAGTFDWQAQQGAPSDARNART